MNYLSLFSGIGGLDLGLDRAGWTCVGQVEKDPYCQRVLAKHWPEVPRHDDVRTAVEWWRSRPRPAVRAVVGGWPCQPVSTAGRRLAQADDRWLWPATAAVIRELRPYWVLLENVAGLLGRGMGDVLGDLAACGYDAEWDCVPAAAVGAPHLRDRVFIVAYPSGRRTGRTRGSVGDGPDRLRLAAQELAHADGVGRRRQAQFQPAGWPEPVHSGWWAAEPRVGRVADGVPGRVDRLRALGNAVVPQVAEWIGRLILAADRTEVAP